MFIKLHNIILSAVFPLDKMMGEVVENVSMGMGMGTCTHINKDYLDCDPAQKPGGFLSMITIYMYQWEINSTVALSNEHNINTN